MRIDFCALTCHYLYCRMFMHTHRLSLHLLSLLMCACLWNLHKFYFFYLIVDQLLADLHFHDFSIFTLREIPYLHTLSCFKAERKHSLFCVTHTKRWIDSITINYLCILTPRAHTKAFTSKIHVFFAYLSLHQQQPDKNVEEKILRNDKMYLIN